MSRNTVLLFPGQGAYLPGSLHDLGRELPELRRALDEVDEVATGAGLVSVSDTVAGSSPPELDRLLLDEPSHILQLTLYASAVGMARTLTAQGLLPTTLVGHSLGEIAALVCGGAFTFAEGAQIVLRRTAVIGEVNPGGAMLAVGETRDRVQHLLDLVGDPDAVIAVVNGPRQTVVSGTDAAMEAVESVCRALRTSVVRLHSPFPFHSPVLAEASRQLAGQLGDLEQRRLTTPVYSPILGRHYTDSDRLTDALAAHLTQSVQFPAALASLRAAGADLFVEAGIGDTLTKLVNASIPDAEAVACVVGRGNPLATFERSRGRLTELGVVNTAAVPDPTELLLPGVPVHVRQAFWAAHGAAVASHVRRLCKEFDPASDPTGEPIPQPAPQPAQPFIQDRVAQAVPAAPAVPPLTQSLPAPSRSALLLELCESYAEALEYPVEVFTEDLELEADLGVDSVKQTELLARAADRYHLPERPADFRLSECSTMGKVADFVLAGLNSGAEPVTANGQPRG